MSENPHRRESLDDLRLLRSGSEDEALDDDLALLDTEGEEEMKRDESGLHLLEEEETRKLVEREEDLPLLRRKERGHEKSQLPRKIFERSSICRRDEGKRINNLLKSNLS